MVFYFTSFLFMKRMCPHPPITMELFHTLRCSTPSKKQVGRVISRQAIYLHRLLKNEINISSGKFTGCQADKNRFIQEITCTYCGLQFRYLRVIQLKIQNIAYKRRTVFDIDNKNKSERNKMTPRGGTSDRRRVVACVGPVVAAAAARYCRVFRAGSSTRAPSIRRSRSLRAST